MKPTAAIAATLLLTLLHHPAAAGDGAALSFEQRCEREMLPVLEVSLREAGVRISNTVSSRVLNRRGTHTVAGQLMLGMTSSKTRADIVLNGSALQDAPGGRECIAPMVAVELSVDPVEVFVAREFHPKSCSYRAVFEHEMRHVQLYREQLPKLEALVRAELERRYAGRPMYAPAGQGLSKLDEQLDGWLRPLLKAELARVEQMQLALDSPEESFRLSHSCWGELASTLGSSF